MKKECAGQTQPWLRKDVVNWEGIARNSAVWNNEETMSRLFIVVGAIAGAAIGGASLAFRIWATSSESTSTAGWVFAWILSVVQLVCSIILFHSMATLSLLASRRKAKEEGDAWLGLMEAEGVDCGLALKAIARVSIEAPESLEDFTKSLEWQLLLASQSFPNLTFPVSRMARFAHVLAILLAALFRLKRPRSLATQLNSPLSWGLFCELFPVQAAIEERAILEGSAGAPMEKRSGRRL